MVVLAWSWGSLKVVLGLSRGCPVVVLGDLELFLMVFR